ncbi:MAG: winged helix-turn-helix domain-containing protein [Brevinema sp.]
MFFNALFSQNALLNNQLAKIGTLYGFEITSTLFLKEKIDPKIHHVVCISQSDPEYREVIQDLKLHYPDVFFVVLIEEKDQISLVDLQDDYLIFIVEDKNDEMMHHQFWLWLFKLLSTRFKITSSGSVQIGQGFFYPVKATFERDGKEFHLTDKQNEMIKMLVQNRGNIVSRISLLEKIWNTDKISTDRVIDTNIVAIRKILGDNFQRKYLQTVSGQGYRLNHE